MKKSFSNKVAYIIVILFFSSLLAYGIVYAANYSVLTMSLNRTASSNGASTNVDANGYPIDSSLSIYDMNPGDNMTATGTLSWGAGFAAPLPAMGMGSVSANGSYQGYIPNTYPMTCTATGGVGGGNSNGSSICERTFSDPYADSGNASYTIYVNSNATRGDTLYRFGLASNGGSKPVEKDFYIRIPFTFSVPAPTIGLSLGSATGQNNAITNNGNNTYSVTLNPGQTMITIPFTFGNSGPANSSLKVTNCTTSLPSGFSYSGFLPTCPPGPYSGTGS